ncbi:chorismate lyase [Thalassomonas viridans]|uniref:Probable chorismate pyruvate-lyase n=1 Tax=Thalassomonas viridans TaxID=137584 RepID=A0AAE9Z5N0_9GAMM|nr:chorismate lyase [Thalassomonas viridans]WDE05582.1 chorismate lyase [Thalassomonas viridans]
MSEQHLLFPVTLDVSWQKPAACPLPAGLRDWLLAPGSLTARLKQLCSHFRVQVLGQQIVPCSQAEAHGDIRPGDQVLVREVILYCDEVAQVFARSLLPLTSLTGSERQLAHLGEQPLGQVIFNSPDLQRKDIEVARLGRQSPVAELARSMALEDFSQLWGRRSLFYLQQKPIMVAEVFLPGAFAYQEEALA